MPNWTIADIPPQAGRLAIVTGATGGLGYETALELARAGAEVVLVGRSDEKGSAALQRILSQLPSTQKSGAQLRFEKADLASLASVRAFTGRMLAEGRPIDLLVNNAGVMLPPARRTTSDGFELQMGTNYLSHFAMTEQLLPLLRRDKSAGAHVSSAQTRVVNVSSLAHRSGSIHFDDMQYERRYIPWLAYGQSKLAMLMFSFELQRRSGANGWGLMSSAAHPGYARTDLMANGPGEHSLLARISRVFSPWISQTAAAGALPILFAATSADAQPAGYYGPDGFQELKGAVAAARIATKAKDAAVARRLWEVSEQLTGVCWPG